ncbi:glycosyltransferase [Cryobacterium gelidum]|uniref:glycosyltransferase n=1 Tax=Cryobacterium gelidum TaxID=1259164 RepID=UPI00141B8FB8|nr:glycosyltransferase [Cryobacterium gelidum]
MTEHEDSRPSTNPRVSIITIAYENRDGLKSTVESVLAQDARRSDWELVIVDGGSMDGSFEYLHSIDHFANWSSQPDRGVYHAMNIGLGRASGDYHIFLNAGDIFFDTESLSTVINALVTNPTWLVGGAMHMNPGGAPFVVANRPHRWERHALGFQPHCHQACVFRADLSSVLGGYSEEFGFAGDFDFILRAGLVESPLEVGEIIARYEGGGKSATGGDETPQLLHRIRVERMQLGRIASAIDMIVVRRQQLRQRAVSVKRRLLLK